MQSALLQVISFDISERLSTKAFFSSTHHQTEFSSTCHIPHNSPASKTFSCLCIMLSEWYKKPKRHFLSYAKTTGGVTDFLEEKNPFKKIICPREFLEAGWIDT